MFGSTASAVRGDAPDLTETLGRLADVLDDLARCDIDAEPDDTVRDAMVALAAGQARYDGAIARVTGVFDARTLWSADRARSAQAWIRHRCRIAPPAAARQVRHARHLRDLPLTLAALCAGQITSAHVQRIADADTARTHDQLLADEAEIIGWATSERFDGFCRHLARWTDEHDPDGGFAPRPDRRRLHLSKTFQDGYAIDGWLDPLGGAIVASELDRLEHDLFRADWDDARERLGRAPALHELARTPGQRRADALVAMAQRSAHMPAGAKRGRILVTVISGVDRFRRLCELLDGTLLAEAEIARLLDDESGLEHILFDHDTQPIGASKQRTFQGVLRRAIRIRDRECAEPGCDEPAERCQVDHIRLWSDHGPTSLDNGRLLCGYHNRARNQAGPVDPNDPGRPTKPPSSDVEQPPEPRPPPGAEAA